MRWAAAALVLLTVACGQRVRIAEEKSLRFVDDSDGTQRFLIAEADSQRQDRSRELFDATSIRKRERSGYVALSRRRLREFLNSAPGFEVEVGSDGEILDTLRDCRCSLSETYTNSMVKIKIGSGPHKGRTGWVCDENIRRLNVWP